MGKVLFGVIAIVASLVIVESLTCNKCNLGLFSYCLSPSSETCKSNTSVCFYGKATFPSLSSFSGFTTQGCLEAPTNCNVTVNNTLLFATYQTRLDCCSADKCNTQSSAASTTKMTLTAALGAAIVASMWGTML